MVVAVLFILSIFLYPVLSIFNGVVVGFNGFGDAIVYSPVTAMALIMVGTLMFAQLKDIDWEDTAIVITGFLYNHYYDLILFNRNWYCCDLYFIHQFILLGKRKKLILYK